MLCDFDCGVVYVRYATAALRIAVNGSLMLNEKYYTVFVDEKSGVTSTAPIWSQPRQTILPDCHRREDQLTLRHDINVGIKLHFSCSCLCLH